MNLEQSEVSQKEKDKYHILTHIYGIQKMVLKNLLKGSNGETVIENKIMNMGRGEESMRCMERVTWKLILSYVKQIANGNLLYGQETQTGALYQLRGVGWAEDGREVQKGGDICIPMADSG